ncbi:MAG: alpha/beta fold hydrolase [Geodermatophilaceae bacterium]
MSVLSPEIQRNVVVDGLRIRTSVRGTGRPLLLIMGLGGNLGMWSPLVGHLLPRGVETIAFDAPGTGQSGAWRLPRRMPAIARVVDRIVQTLGYARVDVLGVSLGGAIAQEFARQAPHRVGRLVLAATMPGVGGLPGSPAVLAKMMTPRRYRDQAYFRQIAGDLYGGRARSDPGALLHGTGARFTAPPSLTGYLHQLYAIQGWTSLPWLHKVRQPTLVMAGDDDPIVPLLNGRILAWRIPNARLHVVRGGGHLFLLEEPAYSAAVIARFLAAD